MGMVKAKSRWLRWGLQIERSHRCRQSIWRHMCGITQVQVTMWLRRQSQRRTVMNRLRCRIFSRAMRVAKQSAGRKARAATESRHAPMKWIICIRRNMDFSTLTQMPSKARSEQRATTAVTALVRDEAISSQSTVKTLVKTGGCGGAK